MSKIQRVILSGGGTGGHIYPALSIYRRLKELNPNIECLYIGTYKGLESEIVPREGIAFETIEIQGIQRSLTLENFKSVWLMLSSSIKSRQLIKDFQPDVVIGTGGYVCAPVLYAAARLGVPTLIHEQNSIPGITNKFLARFVDIIGICFEEARSQFAKYEDKIRFTGNPRAQEVLNYPFDDQILATQFELDPEKKTVLIFGGSRGAPAINKAAIESIEYWSKQDYQVIISTGKVHYDVLLKEVDDSLLERASNLRVVPYIDNMPAVFKAIDLVVCRSGATTLTELTALGLPSILIPSPYVTDNHQEKNALSLVKNEAAIMIREEELNSETLSTTIDNLLHNPYSLRDMSTHAKELSTPNAIDLIIKALEEITD